MQFPESWLREFCDPPIGTAELADKLTMAGLEVEALYGDFDRSPFGDESREYVWVTRRPG